jgi:hypothetical protein
MDFLTINDFQNGQGRLNIGGFTNITKAMSMDEFKIKFDLSGTHHVLTNEAAKRYVSDLVKGVKDDLKKGEGTEITIDKVNEHIAQFKQVKVIEKGNLNVFWVIEKEVDKNKPEDNIQKANENDLEKGNIADSFEYSSQFEFVKTGKEIMEKLTTLKPIIEAQKAAKMVECAACLKEIVGVTPDRVAPTYMYRGFEEKIGKVMMFKYECCRWAENPSDYTTYPDRYVCDKETAMKCQKYNNCIREYVSICVDLCTVDLYSRNLDAKKKYTLTTNQLQSLGF